MPLAQSATSASTTPASKVAKTRTRKPKATKTRGSSSFDIVERESFVIQEGPINTSFRRFVQDRHSSTFHGKRLTTVPKSREHVELRKKETESYTRISGDSFRVETEDGFGLIVAIKGGMYAGKPESDAEQARQKSERAFKDFIKGYPPAEPKPDEYRHIVALEDEKDDWVTKGLPWGRLLLVPWHRTGDPHGPLYLSKHARPGKKKLDAVKDFMTDVTWEHEQISECLKSIDRETWTEMNDHYQDLRSRGVLDYLDQGVSGIHPGLAPIVNLAAQPHIDKGDDRASWTSTNAWGDYEGAWAVFPESKIMFKMEPGDVVFCRAAYVEHWITKILSGQRYCNTRFTKGDVAHPLPTTVKCPIPECESMFGSFHSLSGHLPDKHDGLTDEVVELIINEVESASSAYNEAEARSIGRWLKSRVAKHSQRKASKRATGKRRRGIKVEQSSGEPGAESVS